MTRGVPRGRARASSSPSTTPKGSGPDERLAKTPDVLEDRAAWEQAMVDVVRLPPDPRGRVRGRRALAPAVRPKAGGVEPDLAASEAPEAFAAPGVDRREIRRLRRGDYPPDRRIDLHGLSVPDATRHLRVFVEDCRQARVRCVCVVHGRGLHSAGGVSVLKQAVRASLRGLPAVLAYAPAPPADGGPGAVYVLLRR